MVLHCCLSVSEGEGWTDPSVTVHEGEGWSVTVYEGRVEGV